MYSRSARSAESSPPIAQTREISTYSERSYVAFLNLLCGLPADPIPFPLQTARAETDSSNERPGFSQVVATVLSMSMCRTSPSHPPWFLKVFQVEAAASHSLDRADLGVPQIVGTPRDPKLLACIFRDGM